MVGQVARTFLRYMLLSAKFMEFRPSQHAAAAILHSVRFSLNCEDCKVTELQNKLLIKEQNTLKSAPQLWNKQIE